jgi:hypothetical protein
MKLGVGTGDAGSGAMAPQPAAHSRPTPVALTVALLGADELGRSRIPSSPPTVTRPSAVSVLVGLILRDARGASRGARHRRDRRDRAGFGGSGRQLSTPVEPPHWDEAIGGPVVITVVVLGASLVARSPSPACGLAGVEGVL